jgi:hypothetical protein
MGPQEGNIENFTAEYLRRIDQKLDRLNSRIDLVVSDLSTLKETTGRTDIRLKIVEAHMTGFMSSAKYSLRGRVEAIEAYIHRSEDPS